jgi:RNA polymerase sigma-70 factor, ECF subfamily
VTRRIEREVGTSQAIAPEVEAAKRGDRAALDALLSRLLPRIRNLARYLVRGDGEVDDIAQQVLIAVVRGLPTYRGEGRFESWVDRITARETFAHLRRERAVERNKTGADLFAVPATDAKPDEYLIRRETVKRLDELPLEQRQAIVLHHCAGMSLPEIAEALGVPVDTAKSRIRLGMNKLREKLLAGRESA